MIPSHCRIVKRVDGFGGHFAFVWHRRERAAVVNADARFGVPVASRLLVMALKLNIDLSQRFAISWLAF